MLYLAMHITLNDVCVFRWLHIAMNHSVPGKKRKLLEIITLNYVRPKGIEQLNALFTSFTFKRHNSIRQISTFTWMHEY